MATVLVKHTVQDYLTWKQVFDGNAGIRKASGSKGGKVFQTAGNPNEVTVVLHWDSLENARKFLASPELSSTMQKAGVTGQPQIQFLESETPVAV